MVALRFHKRKEEERGGECLSSAVALPNPQALTHYSVHAFKESAKLKAVEKSSFHKSHSSKDSKAGFQEGIRGL